MSHNSDLPQRVRRVVLIASAGGHWIELIRLTPAVQDCHCLFITTSSGLRAPCGDRPVVQIADGSRDTPWRLLSTVFSLYKTLKAFRPDLLITTGAAPGAAALLIGKLLGGTTVWIDSVANSDELSMSGKFSALFADLRLSQWAQLADKSRNIHYFGSVV